MGSCSAKESPNDYVVGIDTTQNYKKKLSTGHIRIHALKFLEWVSSTCCHEKISDKEMKDNKFKCERIIYMIKNIYNKSIPEFETKPPSFDEINNEKIENIKREEYEDFVLKCIDYVSCFVVDSSY